VIRRIMDFIFLLVFVWVCMLLGLWVIDTLIVPWGLPFGSFWEALSRVVISVSLVLLWLWLWREIVKRTFWGTLKGQRDKS